MRSITFYKLLFLTSIFFISEFACAQVEFKKTVTTQEIGKKSILKKAPPKILIENFSLLFKTSAWVSQGDALNGVGMAVYLQLDEKLAQNIANESYKYFTEELQKRGFEIMTHDPARIKSASIYKKLSGKGKASIKSGITEIDTPKRASNGDATIMAYANGPVFVDFGTNAMAPYKLHSEVYKGEKYLKWNFTTGIGFTKTKSGIMAGGNTSTNAVSTKAELVCENYAGVPTLGYIDGSKALSIVFNSHKLKYSSAHWLADVDENKELYGKSLKYNLDKEQFQKACEEMINAYIDQSIKAYEDLVADN